MLTDPYAHLRPKVESCRTCRNYFPTPKGSHGDCHYLPPNADSFFPTVYPNVWCAQYKEDPLKIAHQPTDPQEK
jgi:hypothetical protein